MTVSTANSRQQLRRTPDGFAVAQKRRRRPRHETHHREALQAMSRRRPKAHPIDTNGAFAFKTRSLNPLECKGNYSATSNNAGWAVTFGPWPLPAVPNVTTHPSTASVSITVLLYNLHCSVALMCLVKG